MMINLHSQTCLDENVAYNNFTLNFNSCICNLTKPIARGQIIALF